jgi:hypothetical protein
MCVYVCVYVSVCRCVCVCVYVCVVCLGCLETLFAEGFYLHHTSRQDTFKIWAAVQVRGVKVLHDCLSDNVRSVRPGVEKDERGQWVRKCCTTPATNGIMGRNFWI